jgi:DtxR family Mn-dependent transcriptional regulator
MRKLTKSPGPQTTATTEEYLEAVYMLDDEGQTVIGARLSELLHVSPPTVTATLRRLVRDGLIRFGRRKEVLLTPKGKETAEKLMRRHRLVERWLTDVLGMGWAKADAEAHRLEHALSPEVEALLNKHLGYPSTCPHGNRIPGNPPPDDKAWRPLSALDPGDRFQVKRVAEPVENATEVLYFVEAWGLVPGARAQLLDREPGERVLLLKIGGRTISVSHYIASNIYVV